MPLDCGATWYMLCLMMKPDYLFYFIIFKLQYNILIINFIEYYIVRLTNFNRRITSMEWFKRYATNYWSENFDWEMFVMHKLYTYTFLWNNNITFDRCFIMLKEMSSKCITLLWFDNNTKQRYQVVCSLLCNGKGFTILFLVI